MSLGARQRGWAFFSTKIVINQRAATAEDDASTVHRLAGEKLASGVASILDTTPYQPSYFRDRVHTGDSIGLVSEEN